MSVDAECAVLLRMPTLRPDDHLQLRIVGTGTQDFRYDQRTGEWTATLDPAAHPDGVEVVVVLDGDPQLDGPLHLSTAELAAPACRIDGRVHFARHQDVLVGESHVARHFFPGDPESTRRYDVIVVGSGAGGGTLAYQLAETPWRGGRPPRVLLLEAGSYLFGTHTGNLARYQPVGPDVYPNIFHHWGAFGRRRWRAADAESAKARIAQGLNLGGRTLFWGASAPRMHRWEFRDWPETVRDELYDVWYDRAEQLTRVTPLVPSSYQTMVKAKLRELPALAEFRHFDPPMAIEYCGPVPGAVPAGIWSAAELLLSRAMQDGRFGNLRVHLNHEVVGVERAAGEVTGVVTYDHLAGRDRTYRLADDGVVVLAAGTVGTAAVAQSSGLAEDIPLVGRGITDHPIHVVKFWMRQGGDWYSRFDSSKTVSRHLTDAADTDPAHPYSVTLDLGANLNQFRFVNALEFTGANLATVDGKMPGELVFMVEAPLVEQNAVTLTETRPVGGKPAALPTIRIHPSPRAHQVQDALDTITADVVSAFGGEVYEQLWAPLGGVSHEVGTMRMGRDTPGRERPGVVDEDLRVAGHRNLYVCDLSVFPNSPAANPTLTLAALAMRLAAHLSTGRLTAPGAC
ncbi:GMC oxidoreductase [Verrucosispora sp. NA02020]|uniref:GMC oxidoreductase n=1 Tax=Verrucosispora sp. NA02020 TaxID=2742132 RepID=UPI00159182AC|nr:GMC oxidoreductase [Verrucosispora sp. NA02020]QKW13690.1 GMC family oxidoreductase [Verrucosispora sp. NA02020]